jgi:PAS domain S-box-containing protein
MPDARPAASPGAARPFFGRRVERQLLLLLCVTAFAAAALYAFVLIAEQGRGPAADAEYNTSWPVSQTAQEVARLQGAIGLHLAMRTEDTREAIDLWLDIVANRLGVLGRGEVGQVVASSGEAVETVAALTALIERSRDRLGSVAGPEAETVALAAISEELSGIAPRLSALASAAHGYTGALAAAYAARLFRLHTQLAVLLFGLVICGCGLCVLLVWNNTLLRRAHAEVESLLGDLRRAGEELSHQNLRFDAALNNMAQGLAMFDARGHLLVSNPAFAALLGLPPGQPAPGTALGALLLGAHAVEPRRAAVLAAIGREHQALAAAGAGALFLREDAEGPAISVSHQPLPEGGWVGTYEDVTPQRRLMREKSVLAADLATLVAAMPGVLVRYRTGAAGGWTRSFVAEPVQVLTGYLPADVQTAEWWQRSVSEVDRAIVAERLDEAQQGRTTTAEFRLRHSSGGEVWVRATMRGDPLSDDGRTVVAIWTDMTREREMAARLAQSTKLAQLGEVATGLAHELNQPLAGISLAAENAVRVLARMPDPPQLAIRKLEVIADLVQRASHVIDHMRIFGRVGPDVSEPVGLAAALDGAQRLLQSELRRAGAHLDRNLPPDLPPVLGRAIPLEQVFMNLISNACHAYDALEVPVPPGRRGIRIAARSLDGGRIRITVEDAAGGIPPHILPRIFEPFFTTKPVGKGTGLGLSISSGLITDMGGTIAATLIEGGTRFTMELPVAVAAPVAA